jgi:hypothetical protein
MIGGPPMMMPQMPQQFPQQFPTMPAMQPPQFPTGQAMPRPAPAAPMMASGPAPQPRAVRGVPADEPAPEVRPTRLAIPAPEQMGISASAVAASAETPVDWAAIHRRLDSLGITCFHIERESAGWRVVCLQSCCCTPGKHHRIEAQGSSQGEAVQLALEQAERPGCK